MRSIILLCCLLLVISSVSAQEIDVEVVNPYDNKEFLPVTKTGAKLIEISQGEPVTMSFGALLVLVGLPLDLIGGGQVVDRSPANQQVANIIEISRNLRDSEKVYRIDGRLLFVPERSGTTYELHLKSQTYERIIDGVYYYPQRLFMDLRKPIVVSAVSRLSNTNPVEQKKTQSSIISAVEQESSSSFERGDILESNKYMQRVVFEEPWVYVSEAIANERFVDSLREQVDSEIFSFLHLWRHTANNDGFIDHTITFMDGHIDISQVEPAQGMHSAPDQAPQLILVNGWLHVPTEHHPRGIEYGSDNVTYKMSYRSNVTGVLQRMESTEQTVRYQGNISIVHYHIHRITSETAYDKITRQVTVDFDVANGALRLRESDDINQFSFIDGYSPLYFTDLDHSTFITDTITHSFDAPNYTVIQGRAMGSVETEQGRVDNQILEGKLEFVFAHEIKGRLSGKMELEVAQPIKQDAKLTINSRHIPFFIENTRYGQWTCSVKQQGIMSVSGESGFIELRGIDQHQTDRVLESKQIKQPDGFTVHAGHTKATWRFNHLVEDSNIIYCDSQEISGSQQIVIDECSQRMIGRSHTHVGITFIPGDISHRVFISGLDSLESSLKISEMGYVGGFFINRYPFDIYVRNHGVESNQACGNNDKQIVVILVTNRVIDRVEGNRVFVQVDGNGRINQEEFNDMLVGMAQVLGVAEKDRDPLESLLESLRKKFTGDAS